MYKILFLLFSLFFLASCTPSEGGVVSIAPTHTESTPIALEDIGSLNNGQTESTGSFAFYADYPIFSGTYLSDHIRVWLQSEIELASQEAKENQEYMADLRPEFMASFDIYTGAITTVTYNVGKYIGGAHGSEMTKSFPIDRRGNRVLFSDLFDNYEKNKDTIRTAMIHAAEKVPGTWEKADVGTSVSDGVDEFLADPNFYLSGSELVLMYQKYQIGPGVLGTVNVVFPDTHLLKKDITGSGKYDALPKIPQENQSGSISQDMRLIDEVAAAEGTKYIALTFDDGPSKSTTPKLLDILKKNGARATFYVLGKNTSYFPNIVKRAHDEGHEIGSHSWDHPQLTRLSETELYAQKTKTDAVIKGAIGSVPVTFRPSYGSINATVKRVFARPAILWSVDTLDWKYRNISHNVSVVTGQAKSGAIVLFHDIHATSVDSIESIIKNLQAKGYKFVTVSDLLARGHGGKPVTGAVTCSTQWSCK